MRAKIEPRDVVGSRRRRGMLSDRIAIKESLHKLNRIVETLREDKDEIARLKADTRKMLDQLSTK